MRLFEQSIVACLLLFGPGMHAQTTSKALEEATSLVRAGQYDAAIAEVESEAGKSPTDPRLRTVEGVAYSLKGDSAHALDAFGAALRAAPGFPAALKAEAQILTREHRAEAVPVLLELLKQDPHDGVAREMLALEQTHAGDCSSAIANFEELTSALDTHPHTLLQYGGCLFSLGKFSQAAAVFTRVAERQPGDPAVLYDLALSQVDAGEDKSALATLTPLLSGAADLDTLTLSSEAEEATGDTPQAVALMRRAIVLDPTLADSYVRFAELCMAHESYQAGIDMVSAGIARLPQSAPLYLARGMLYGGESQYSPSEADFHTAELLDPNHGTGAFGIGLVQSQSNHPEEALATARAALRAHPEDPRLNFLLARLLIEGGEKPGSAAFAEAFAAAQKSVQLLPDFLAAHDLLAKIFMLNGEIPQAIVECRAALKIDPNDEAATYRLLLASRQMGDMDTVRELSKRVTEQHQQARNDEAKRLRFRIVDAKSAADLPTGEGAKMPQ